MFSYDEYAPLRWDKIVAALKEAAYSLKQQDDKLEYDEMKWSYLYPAIAEREHRDDTLGRYRSPYLNWNKIVCAIEKAASLLLNDHCEVEHEEVKNRYLTDAVTMRDSYLFLMGKDLPTGATTRNKRHFNWLRYQRPSTIFSLSDRRKLLQQALTS